VALSDEHIEKHLRGWTEQYINSGDYGGGGHSGMTLGVWCGLLAEPPERVAKIAMGMVAKSATGDLLYFAPGLCGIPKIPVWYMYQTSYPSLPDGRPGTREQICKVAIAIAEAYPMCGFVQAKAYKEEFQRVIDGMGLRVPTKEMTDETCVHCHVAKPPKKRVDSIFGAGHALRQIHAVPLGQVDTKEFVSEALARPMDWLDLKPAAPQPSYPALEVLANGNVDLDIEHDFEDDFDDDFEEDDFDGEDLEEEEEEEVDDYGRPR
jgi:hypothetical protein